MLLILCMIVGAFIAYFGVKLSVSAIQHSNNADKKKEVTIVGCIAIAIILIGIWIFTNAMELYYYIVHNGLMDLFF